MIPDTRSLKVETGQRPAVLLRIKRGHSKIQKGPRDPLAREQKTPPDGTKGLGFSIWIIRCPWGNTETRAYT